MSKEKKCVGNRRFHCYKCGRFVGKDGFIDIFYDDYMGGYEEGYSLCAFCLKKQDEDREINRSESIKNEKRDEVTNQTLKDVLDTFFETITKEPRETKPYKDLFKKSDDIAEFLRDVNHKMMKVVLDSTQVLRDKYGICPNEVYNILKCLPFVTDYMRKRIENEEGMCCCVDKVYYLLSQKIKLELIEAEKTKKVNKK